MSTGCENELELKSSISYSHAWLYSIMPTQPPTHPSPNRPANPVSQLAMANPPLHLCFALSPPFLSPARIYTRTLAHPPITQPASCVVLHHTYRGDWGESGLPLCGNPTTAKGTRGGWRGGLDQKCFAPEKLTPASSHLPPPPAPGQQNSFSVCLLSLRCPGFRQPSVLVLWATEPSSILSS